MARAGRRIRFIRLVAAALTAAACREPVYPVRDTEVRMVSASQWAGGEIVLTSPSFFGADTLPLVFFGPDTLPVRFAPPDTVVAVAPAALGTGTVQVQFASGGRVTVGEVRIVAGFTGWWEGPPVGGHPTKWPSRTEARFVVDGASHLLLIDPAARTSQDYLPDTLEAVGCMHGPGFDADGALVLVRRRPLADYPNFVCGPMFAYTDPTSALAIDSGPTGWDWLGVRLGPGDWIRQSKYAVDRLIRRPAGNLDTASWWALVQQPEAYAVSPVSGRAVPIGATLMLGQGIPVFARGVLSPVYYLAGYSWSQGAVFSDDGDTLFFAATMQDTTPLVDDYVIAAVRAADGTVMRSARNAIWSDNLLLDPSGKWIYSVGVWGPNGPLVQVFDRASLRLIATMQPPAGALLSVTPYAAGYLFTPILSASDRKLYVVGTYPYGSTFGALPLVVCSFKLPD
jgi:hypothetical protein